MGYDVPRLPAGPLLREGVLRARSTWMQNALRHHRACRAQATHPRRLCVQWLKERYMWDAALLSWRASSWHTDSYHGDTRVHYALTLLQAGPLRVSLM